jgi:hypothetical protein
VYLIRIFKAIHTPGKNIEIARSSHPNSIGRYIMNIQKIRKIAQRLALAIGTITTIAISAPAPSRADTPTGIIDPVDGRPPVAVFLGTRESYGIGCPELDQLWSGSPYQNVTADRYNNTIKSRETYLTGFLRCDGLYQGYSSTAIPGGHMLIVKHMTDGRLYRHLVTPEFFTALKVTPKQLSPQEGEKILKQFPLVANTDFTSNRSQRVFPRPEPPLFPTLGSRALPPRRIIVAPGKPQLVVFGTQSFKIGCMRLRSLWDPMPTIQVNQAEYENALNFRDGRSFLRGELTCNTPQRIQGFTSPAFTPYGGVISIDGNIFAVSSKAFFGSIGINPKDLNDTEGRTFLRENSDVFKNPVLVTNR